MCRIRVGVSRVGMVRQFARASGEPMTPAFVRRFAEMASRWAENANPTTRGIKALLSQLDVEYETSQEEHEQLLVEGLKRRVEREASEPV